MRIAVDVMGGDHGCDVVIHGVKRALESPLDISELFLVGKSDLIDNALMSSHLSDSRLRIQHAETVLTMEDKPIDSLRKKKDCSLAKAVELLSAGRADALVSVGNTGGLVAASTVKLRRLENVDRPAIATVIPAVHNQFILLDSGANPECKPIHLMQFAIMGCIYSRELLGYQNPRVGILSNGKEQLKGNDLTRNAAKLCDKIGLNFVGYVEGHDLFDNQVEVVVIDGFIGNIVLKTIESMGKSFSHLLASELKVNSLRKLGALVAGGAFRSIRRRMNPDSYGGAPLLGLNGNVIKAHGSAKSEAIMNAIRVSTETIKNEINSIINREVHLANSQVS